jgi:hypothetical protein
MKANFSDESSIGEDCVLQISMSGSHEAILERLLKITEKMKFGRKPCQGIIQQFDCVSQIITPVWNGHKY